jgi:hypothetical protein
MKLEITNKKIIDFYEKNSKIDFEAMNLMLIDFIDQLQTNSNACISSINSQLLSNLNENKENLSQLSSCVLNMKENIESLTITKATNILQGTQQPIYNMLSSCEERINTNINCVKDMANLNQTKQNQILNEMYECITKRSRPPSPNIIDGEDQLVISLSQQYCTAEFNTRNSQITMKRSMKPIIMLYNMNIERNVNQEELKPFFKCVEENLCHGIFLSQSSGIASKTNYCIDIVNGYIQVFIHNVNYSIDKIKIAIDLIDNLSVKMKQFNSNDRENSIPKDVLDEINKDFQMFLTQKEAIINVMKESHKKILAQLDEMKFSALEKYLSTKFTPTNVKQGFKCDLCKYFTANNLKALAAHKRGCVRKNNVNAIENVTMLCK